MATSGGPSLPCSRSALDQLGKRLAREGDPARDDRILLMSVLAAYDEVLVASEARVRRTVAEFSSSHQVSLEIATRVKTTGTIREKLRRQRGMGLKGMQDIAGVRVAGAMTRSQQNELGSALLREFSDSSRPSRLSDRRVYPSHGYRALHVIADVQGLPIEIQIRTSGQDAWAQLVEQLGDVWGRGIRYGEPPIDPTRAAVGELSRARVVDLLLRISDELDEDAEAALHDETLAHRVAALESALNGLPDQLGTDMTPKAMLEQLADLKTEIAERMQRRSDRQDERRELLNLMTEAAGGWH